MSRFLSREQHWNWKGGTYITPKFCPDCNKRISYRARKCRSCAHKGLYRILGGWRNNRPKCIICHNPIGRHSNAKKCKKCYIIYLENNNPFLGRKHTEETKLKIRLARPRKIKHCIDCHKEIKNWYAIRCVRCAGKNWSKKYTGKFINELNPNWKKGISRNLKHYRQRRLALFKGGGKLSVKTIQQVYEDNIKQFGTLTCYLCLQPISFGRDSVDHKTPLSRNGTNQRENLEIACRNCNSKKHNKTTEEYIKSKETVF